MKNKKKSLLTIKKHIVLFFTISMFFIGESFAQSATMPNFFKYNGVKQLAALAHPTNTYKSGSYSVNNDYVLVNIYYEEATTELKIYRSKDFFTGIYVIRDTDWWPPFRAIQDLKDLIISELEDEEDRTIMTGFEKRFNKTLRDMTGKEMSCILLTLGWYDY